ncbi:hypothetical protein JXR93_00375 [bacterium]|nr:hypothetical protein [bacterium]
MFKSVLIIILLFATVNIYGYFEHIGAGVGLAQTRDDNALALNTFYLSRDYKFSGNLTLFDNSENLMSLEVSFFSDFGPAYLGLGIETDRENIFYNFKLGILLPVTFLFDNICYDFYYKLRVQHDISYYQNEFGIMIYIFFWGDN